MDQHCVCGNCTWARDMITNVTDHPDLVAGAVDALLDHAWAVADAAEGDHDAIRYVKEWCKLADGPDLVYANLPDVISGGY